MAMPDVLQEYIVNKTITIKPSDWDDKQYHGWILGGGTEVPEYVILVQPTNAKLYLQNGIKAELVPVQQLVRLDFTTKTVPTKNIIVNVSVIKDTNK